MSVPAPPLRRHRAGYYIYTRLFWDPTRDVDAMIRDYCEKGFGPAADKIEAYFDYLEKLTTDIANTVKPRSHVNHMRMPVACSSVE